MRVQGFAKRRGFTTQNLNRSSPKKTLTEENDLVVVNCRRLKSPYFRNNIEEIFPQTVDNNHKI